MQEAAQVQLLEEVLNWAWERPHNPSSRYIRPLFRLRLLRLPGEARRGSLLTLLALATSMAWFPTPQVHPRAAAFVAAEANGSRAPGRSPRWQSSWPGASQSATTGLDPRAAGLALDYAVRRRAGGAAGSQERAAEAPMRAIRRE